MRAGRVKCKVNGKLAAQSVVLAEFFLVNVTNFLRGWSQSLEKS